MARLVNAPEITPRHLRAIEHLLLEVCVPPASPDGERCLLSEQRVDELLAALPLFESSPLTCHGVRRYAEICNDLLATRTLDAARQRLFLRRIRAVKYGLRDHYLNREVMKAAVQCLVLISRLSAQAERVSGLDPTARGQGWLRLAYERLPDLPGSDGSQDVFDDAVVEIMPATELVSGPNAAHAGEREDLGASTAAGSGSSEGRSSLLEPPTSRQLATTCMDGELRTQGGPEEANRSWPRPSRSGAAARGGFDAGRPGTPDAVSLPSIYREVHLARRPAPLAHRPVLQRLAERGPSSVALLSVAIVLILRAQLVLTPPPPTFADPAVYASYALSGPSGRLPFAAARRFGNVLILTATAEWAGLGRKSQQQLLHHLADHLVGRDSIDVLLVLDRSGRELGRAMKGDVVLELGGL
jgi:hypothetical protein